MIWSYKGSNISHVETPFEVYPGTYFGDYCVSPSGHILATTGNRIYAVVSNPKEEEEIKIEFKEYELFEIYKDKPYAEQLKLLSFIWRLCLRLWEVSKNNVYNQQTTFTAPYTQLKPETFKVYSSTPLTWDDLKATNPPENRLHVFHSSLAFLSGPNYSIHKNANIITTGSLVYIGRPDTLSKTKFSYRDLAMNVISPLRQYSINTTQGVILDISAFSLPSIKVLYTA